MQTPGAGNETSQLYQDRRGRAGGQQLTACGGSQDSGSLPGDALATAQKVVVGWNRQALQAVRKVKPGPPTGSDAFGASYTRDARTLAIEPNLPSADLTLRWATFTEAAEEAGISRIYGGIHFDQANLAGQELGRKVGAQVFERARKYWEGQG